MDASTIGLIVTGVVAFIILVSMISGAKRGLKKETFRGAWLLLTAIGLLFLTPVITGLILGIDISSLGLDIMGPVSKISDIGTNIFNQIASANESLANSEVLKALAESLPTMILNILLFTLLFWILKIVLFPIYAMIANRIFEKQKRELKKFKKQQKRNREKGVEVQEDIPIELSVKKKNNAVGGAVVGIVVGLLLCAVTFMPVIGVNTIYQNVYANAKTEQDGEEVSIVETSIEDKQLLSYLSLYEDSIASKIFTYTGVQAVSNSVFGELASANVGNEKVRLTDEVNMAVNVYSQYYTIKDFDRENMTRESLEKVLSAVQSVLKEARTSKLLYILGDEILPSIIDEYVTDDLKLVDDGGEFDKILIDALKSYSANFSMSGLQEQAESLIEVVSTLNNYDLMVPIINGEIESVGQVVHMVATNVVAPNTFAKNVSDGIFKIKILQDDFATLFSNGVKKVFEALDIPYTEQTLDTDTLQTSFRSILLNSVTLSKYYESSDNFDFDEDTLKAMTTVGNTLDIIKETFLNEENYNSLINFLVDKINEATASFADFSDITENLKSVKVWGVKEKTDDSPAVYGELYVLTNLYKSMIKLVNDEVGFDDILDPDYTLVEDFGDGLQSAIRGGSKLITNKSIRSAIEIVLDTIDTGSFDEFLNINIVGDNKTLKNRILDNIYVEGGSYSLNWANEIRYNIAIFRNAYKIVEGDFALAELSRSTNTTLDDLGKSIDKAFSENANLFLAPQVIRSVLDYYITNKVELPTDAKNILDIVYGKDNLNEDVTVYDQVLINIYNPADEKTVSSWETEFGKIKNVINANFDTSDLPALGKILDGVSGSQIFTKTLLNTVVSKYIDDETATEDTTSMLYKLKGAISAMKGNLNNVVSYEKEFGYFVDLIDIINKNYEDSEAGERQRYTDIGEEFNKVSNIKNNSGEYSQVLTKGVLNEFLTTYFDDFVKDNFDESDDAELIEILNKVKGNFVNIADYKVELLNILDLGKTVGASSIVLSDVGKTLDDIDSNIITRFIVGDLLVYFINDTIRATTLDDEVSDVITDIKNTIKAIHDEQDDIKFSVYNLNYEREFGYIDDVTKLVKESSLDYSSVGVTFDEICGYKEDSVKSEFISRDNLVNVLNYFIDKSIKDSVEDTKLATILGGIKDNISKITGTSTGSNFTKEFGYLGDFFKVLENYYKDSSDLDEGEEPTTLTDVGSIFDWLKDNNCVIVATSNINDIIMYFFDDKTGYEYDGDTDTYSVKDDIEDFARVVKAMRTKISGVVSGSSFSYETLLSELDTIVANMQELGAYSSVDSLTNIDGENGIGRKLDSMEKMTHACDNVITHECVDLLIEKLLKDESSTVKEAAGALMNGGVYDFEKYTTEDFTGSYPRDVEANGRTYQYYTDLLKGLKEAVDTAKSM